MSYCKDLKAKDSKKIVVGKLNLIGSSLYIIRKI